MQGRCELLLEFVYLDLFERTAGGVLTEADLVALEWRLIADPRAGSWSDIAAASGRPEWDDGEWAGEEERGSFICTLSEGRGCTCSWRSPRAGRRL